VSNSLAIAATTATLRAILQAGITADADLVDTTVTIAPLDKARGANTANQLNLFLYMVARNPAWANADMPRQVRSGETGQPALPLNLHYLVTAFGRDDDLAQPFGHALLGKAMSVLHDHQVLSADDIRNAAGVLLPRSDLAQQLERIRITLHPMTLDELSKLWTGFAMQYRLSAGYEVAVTLIESTRPARTPLPVVARGAGDTGVAAQSGLASPLPTIDSLVLPRQQPNLRLGERIGITGRNLAGTAIEVLLSHRLWSAPVAVAPEAGGTATALGVVLPNQPAAWPAGLYTLAVRLRRPGETFARTTNTVWFSVAPTVSLAPASAPAGDAAFTATVAPEVRADQRAALMLNDREIPAADHPVQAAALSFVAAGLAPGEYWVRLRVDGVDSQLVDRSLTPPAFDALQKVTVT
jgi:hypothetical protein